MAKVRRAFEPSLGSKLHHCNSITAIPRLVHSPHTYEPSNRVGWGLVFGDLRVEEEVRESFLYLQPYIASCGDGVGMVSDSVLHIPTVFMVVPLKFGQSRGDYQSLQGPPGDIF